MALASGGVESGNGNEGRNRPSSLLGSRCQGLAGRRHAKQHEPRLWIVQSFGDGARFLARRAFMRGYVPSYRWVPTGIASPYNARNLPQHKPEERKENAQ